MKGPGAPKKKYIDRGEYAKIYNKTKFYCPHCQKVFTYKEMWKRVTTDFASIWEIIEVLERGFSAVRAIVTRLRLDLKISGTQQRLDWEELARKTQYKSPEAMLFHLHVTKQLPFTKVAQLLDIDDKDIVKNAFRKLVEPENGT